MQFSLGEAVSLKSYGFPKIQHKGSGLEPTIKRCELPLFFTGIGQAVRRWKALDLGGLNMQFQQDWPIDKKLQLF